MNEIIVKGARENNLKNIDITLPKNKFIVMTGVSGSGKSSLAFDTIYAEGQRRYVESLSAYARQFIGNTQKPDVDSIEGLSPSISIDQKSTNKNPRSTVGTITEIYDYLRLLYARIGIPHCPFHHIPITSQSIEEMTNKIMSFEGEKIAILAPVIHGEKGTHKEEIEEIKKEGYSKLRVNGNYVNINDEIILEKNTKDNIEIVIDRLTVIPEERSRIFEDIEAACNLADGKVLIIIDEKELLMSEKYACPLCDFYLPELEPRLFSFNSPYGACEDCKGIGTKLKISEDLLVPDKERSLSKGAIIALGNKGNIYWTELKEVCKNYNIDMDIPIKKIPREKLNIIFYGTKEKMDFKYVSKTGNVRYKSDYYEGFINTLERRYLETTASWIRDWISSYMVESTCETCKGTRLQDGVLSVYINKKNIYDMTCMNIGELIIFLENLKLTNKEKEISSLVLKEIISRLSFLNNVGLSYLSLNRSAGTLSGGEAQRIRLATQIGSKLSGVLYVLDEPSIGLHQRDNQKLIDSLKEMRDLGNTLIVVEHDSDTMMQSDFLVDIGPGAGDEGGQVVCAGLPEEVMKCQNSITGKYLSGKLKIPIPNKRRKGNGKYLEIIGAKENNLKKIDVKFPLGKLIAVTGVSGSGKSSLVNEILYKYLQNKLYRSKVTVGNYEKIKGESHIDKVVMITQDAIGRTPRSNPSTYVGVFDDIRELFTNVKEARIRGYGKSKFSFNVKGGRCEACLGDGVRKIEMHFLPDVYVPCDVCNGKRYNKETLEIKYKGKNISDILDMRVSEALEFFKNIPKIHHKLKTMDDVGLSYVKFGQNAVTLSGGEAGRVKLAKELQKKPTGKSIFILDEPTTGLHVDDIKKLLNILNKIVDNGDTVIVIEHNLDVIKTADYIIDLGPEGGSLGGKKIAEGTPEEVAKNKQSYTGVYLTKILDK
ncbi:MAG: excinuclease ABC subunit UvrA [Mollicutes bacterium]|nr:excinuclease ABC subunit UvrA [Mollicutes bacterium]